MRTPKRIIHCIATCEKPGCDFVADDYRTAARRATIHAKANPGHEVHVEQGLTYIIKRN